MREEGKAGWGFVLQGFECQVKPHACFPEGSGQPPGSPDHKSRLQRPGFEEGASVSTSGSVKRASLEAGRLVGGSSIHSRVHTSIRPSQSVTQLSNQINSPFIPLFIHPKVIYLILGSELYSPSHYILGFGPLTGKQIKVWLTLVV